MKYTFEDIQKVIQLHNLYLLGQQGGQKADLKNADLYGCSLVGAVLKALIWKAQF